VYSRLTHQRRAGNCFDGFFTAPFKLEGLPLIPSRRHRGGPLGTVGRWSINLWIPMAALDKTRT
jgi:hypothetical protein